MGSNLRQALKALNLFRLLESETIEIFTMGKRSKSKYKFGGMKVCEVDKVREYFIKPEIENGSFRLVCKFSLDFRKVSWFISKNILQKVVLKYEVSILTCPSTVHTAYPKIHFRIMRTVNALSQQYINRKFQKYISVTICHCYRVSLMTSLFTAFKNDECCHFVVRIRSAIETPKWSFEEWLASALSN